MKNLATYKNKTFSNIFSNSHTKIYNKNSISKSSVLMVFTIKNPNIGKTTSVKISRIRNRSNYENTKNVQIWNKTK